MSPQDQLRPGTVIGGWRLVELLGAGSFGHVWAVAKDFDPEWRRAMKVLPARPAALQELRRLSDLDHPHVVKVADAFGSTRGAPLGTLAIVMDLGTASLASHAAARGRLGQEEVRRIGVALAAGLAYLHDGAGTRGRVMVHGDLKPANVVLSDDRWRLADFGLATIAATDSARGSSAQRRHPQPPGTKGDVWALGLTLWELLDGPRPRRFDAALGRLMRTSDHSPLMHVVKRCMAADPEERPTATAAFDLLDGVPRPARPDPSLAVAGSADLLERTGTLNGWLRYGERADPWVHRGERNDFYLAAIEALHAQEDLRSLRALSEAADNWNDLPPIDPLPGAGQLLTPEQSSELRARIRSIEGPRVQEATPPEA